MRGETRKLNKKNTKRLSENEPQEEAEITTRITEQSEAGCK